MNSIQILVNLLNDSAKLPTKAHETDAGWDIYSPIDITIKKHSYVIIDSFISICPKIPKDADYLIYGQLKGRSGLSLLNGIEVCNAGVIDQDYRGTIKVKLYNTGNADYHIKKGDRICQIIFFLIPKIRIDLVDSQKDANIELFKTSRSINGIGSTGK